MKASDYIVEYLIEKGITDVFGYPGGMVTHLMDSFSKYAGRIAAHLTYHEQGAAFAACGYAQASGKVGVAYATSGPGATNLITGICDAYFDSIPSLFITGQVNTFESAGNLNVRQRGFQETDIVSMVSGVTKFAERITDAARLKWYLDYAFTAAMEGRKGPVLLDIPMNIFRAEIDPARMEGYIPETASEKRSAPTDMLKDTLRAAKRPVLLMGNGIKTADAVDLARSTAKKLRIPTVSTMLAVDIIDNPALNYGFIGAYGSRTANFIIAKSDLVISLGARLDVRQVGAVRKNFAPGAKLLRVDIDAGELEYKVHDDEIPIQADVADVLAALAEIGSAGDPAKWLTVCAKIREELDGRDDRRPNHLLRALSEHLPEDALITADVGQNQVWAAQSLHIHGRQRAFFSGGHGAMGYSLPAAIGVALASGRPVYSFNGDGGLQMNIQELQTIAREQLPITIVLLNNAALGMIRHFQEMYFENNFCQTIPSGGYTVPDFGAIARAYGLDYSLVEAQEDICAQIFRGPGPKVIEIRLSEPTYVFPKLEYGKPNHDQEPLLDRALFARLEEL